MNNLNIDSLNMNGLDLNNNIRLADNASERTWLNLTIGDWAFISILGVVVLIILFSSRPMISPAIESIGSDLSNNVVTDFVMSKVSTSYVLSKEDDELKEALDALKKPHLSNRKLGSLKKMIDHDIESVINEEIGNKLVRRAALDAVSGGKKFRSIIGYSIINRMRRNVAQNGGTVRQYEPRNVHAVELIHSACLIMSDLMDKDETRRGGLSVHNSHDQNIALATAMQLNLIGLKLVGEVDHVAKYYAVENQIKKRMEAEKVNTPEKVEMPDTFELAYNLSLSACNDINVLTDGQVLDVYGKKSVFTSSKHKALDFMRRKSCSDFNLMFEMAWVIGGGSIKAEYIDMVRSMGTDFGLLYQIYDDFTDYYSDQIDNSINFVSTMGIEEAHNEFFSRVKSFVGKATQLGVMTGALKHVVSYLSDSVTLAEKIIRSDQKKLSNSGDDDSESDDSTATDETIDDDNE
jgi:geranylgeranyl pyrophosphate synthase